MLAFGNYTWRKEIGLKSSGVPASVSRGEINSEREAFLLTAGLSLDAILVPAFLANYPDHDTL